jgi:hypothetical protein
VAFRPTPDSSGKRETLAVDLKDDPALCFQSAELPEIIFDLP